MKNKHLVIIFVLLAIAVYFSRKQYGKRERSFETVLIAADSTTLSRVVFLPPGGNEFSLTKESSGWILTDGERSAQADAEPVSKLLAALHHIETRQIAAKTKELWPVYGTDERQGFRIKLYKDNKLLHDFYLGREDFDPNSRSVISFIRMEGEPMVFAVDGMLTMHIGKTFDSYRNRLLVRMKRDMEVTSFTWALPDTTLDFRRTPRGWTLGMQVLDSMQVENYLNLFRNVSCESYADDFDELKAEDLPQRILTIQGKNIPEPVVITCYENPLRRPPYVLHSTQNLRAFFAADSAMVFSQYFPALDMFLPVAQ